MTLRIYKKSMSKKTGSWCGTRVCSMTMSNRCAHHVLDKSKSESCLVKAPAQHAGQSVLVVSELLCTSVQATLRGTRNKRNARNVLMLGYKQHSSSRQSGEWRDIELPTELALGSKATNLALNQSGRINYLTEFKEFPTPAPKYVDFTLTRDETGDRLSRTRTTQAISCVFQKLHQSWISAEFFCRIQDNRRNSTT